MCTFACVFMVAVADADADGRRANLRIETAHGPVQLWAPDRYDAATASVVVYIHGFYTTVDRAWHRHRLPRQFEESRINALFIACAAPRGPRDDVKWNSLGQLLDVVSEHIEIPRGRIIVVGHSGAHRTLSRWLPSARIDTVVLVDAFFGTDDTVRTWLDADPGHRLIDVAADTRRWTDALHAELPETLLFERFPPAKAGVLRGARDARVVYVRSQYDHMSLVTRGTVLPMLLRALRVPIVEHASRKAPIRALPVKH
jgi:hypothetical protein